MVPDHHLRSFRTMNERLTATQPRWYRPAIRRLGAVGCVGVLALGLALETSGAGAATPKRASEPLLAKSKIKVKIVGQNHDPIVDHNWKYTVTIKSSSGKKLSGTETTEYLYNGSVVGTEKPKNKKFKNGVYHDVIQFPSTSVGYPLVVEATVKTKDGDGKAGWTVMVKTS